MLHPLSCSFLNYSRYISLPCTGNILPHQDCLKEDPIVNILLPLKLGLELGVPTITFLFSLGFFLWDDRLYSS